MSGIRCPTPRENPDPKTLEHDLFHGGIYKQVYVMSEHPLRTYTPIIIYQEDEKTMIRCKIVRGAGKGRCLESGLHARLKDERYKEKQTKSRDSLLSQNECPDQLGGRPGGAATLHF